MQKFKGIAKIGDNFVENECATMYISGVVWSAKVQKCKSADICKKNSVWGPVEWVWETVDWVRRVLPEAKLKNKWILFFEFFDLSNRC